MAKLDEMRKAMTLGRPGAYPPGINPSQVVGMSERFRGVEGDSTTAWIELDRIDRDPEQPRTEFDSDELGRLADSLKTKGQLQSIRVRWDEGRGLYVLISGERRWRAAKLAGLPTLQAIIHDKPVDPNELLGLQLIENALREDLKPIEQARAYRRLMDSHGWTMTVLAQELSLHKATVSRALSLLELPESIQAKVETGQLAVRAATEIGKLPNPSDQIAVVEAIEGQGLDREAVAKVVRNVKAGVAAKKPSAKPEPVMIDLGTFTVQVKWKSADGLTLVQVAKRFLKAAQEQEKAAQEAA